MTQWKRPQGRDQGFGFLLVIVPSVSALTILSPLAASAAVGTLAAGLWFTLANPTVVVALTALLITATPKAGVNVGAFPFPVMMLVLFASIPVLRRASGPSMHRGERLALVALTWLACRLVMMAFAGGNLADLFALIGWFGLPLILVLGGPALGSLRGNAGRLWVSRMELGLLVACAFSIVQQVFGIERTAIPGITRAIGADYALKPLAFAGGTKIPSTYQNGNVLGVITAFFFLLAADRYLRGRRSRRDRLVLAATAGVTLLSGSRTAVFGLALGLLALLVASRVRPRTLVVVVVLGMATLGILAFSPVVGERIFGTRSDDPNITFRTSSWTAVLQASSTWELVAGGTTWVKDEPDPGQAEGVVGVVQQVGLIGAALFVAVVIAATGGSGRRWRILLIPVIFSIVVDSAYLVFPTLFIPLVRMFAQIDPSNDEAPAHDGAGAQAITR